MKKKRLAIFLILCTTILIGQDSNTETHKSIGVNYFGELGFRPGIEIDYKLNLWKIEKEKNVFEKQLNLRPSFAYYRYSHYSNNFLISLKLNYQLKFNKKENGKYLFIEPSIRMGYLRYFFIGNVYELNNNEFTKKRFRGSNSFIFGGAFDFGGYLSKKADWIAGFDYYAEATEDKLILHRFVVKLGTRIKF